MKKLIAWCKHNFFGIVTLFLLVFIPLYPKLPLLDIKNTWVYVRAEDFIVLGVLLVSTVLLFQKKITLRTPLTIPMFVYWIIGAVATIHGILLIFPTLANVFPNVAFLSFLRRIEYMSLFFIAFWGVKEKRFLLFVSVALAVTLTAASLYGLGQKYFGLPAFLTMNEEFAKGTPIQLSQLSRVPSTFAGHYDFAAYLVLIIPILVSLVFSAQTRWVRGVLLTASAVGALALFTTVSRISFIAFFVAVGLVLYIQKKRIILLAIPVLVLGAYFVLRSPLAARYVNTVKEVQVLVDATNGNPLGHINFVEKSYFQHKEIRQQFFKNMRDIKETASPAAKFVIPYDTLPPQVPLLVQPIAPTGEDLPQGTGYINLSLSPVTKKIGNFYYDAGNDVVQIINGSYLIKRTLAYDLSFTTRFQGEWPNAVSAFKKNILVGSGFGSVSLAVDNSYLRMLGEVGTLGFISFGCLFVLLGIYIRHMWPRIESHLTKSFVVGVSGGILGLAVNALFIDVFEASKIAFVLWLLVGITVGVLHLSQKGHVDLIKSLRALAVSPAAIVVYLFIITMVLYGSMTGNYFVGDDFTWFRWADRSPRTWSTVVGYFTNADGFFYRPGAKLYYLGMYWVFWLNQNAYHIVSIALHFVVAVLTFFLAGRIFGRRLPAAAAAILFLILTGGAEAVFWISATGFLFAAVFILVGLLSYIRGNIALAVICSLAAPLFHEVGIVAPLLMLVYTLPMTEDKKINYRIFIPIPLYLAGRFLAHSHWFSGDYNYNIWKLPFNAVGNTVGYLLIGIGGPVTTPLYQALRANLREHMAVGVVLLTVIGIAAVWATRYMIKRLDVPDRRVVWFCLLFTVVSLLPFLGLGNISSRYGYVATIGVVLLLVFLGEKIYQQLLVNSRQIAVYGVTLLACIVSLFQIIQLQELHDNWHEAGEKVRNFVTSIDAAYEDQWAQTPMQLHFVDVPIRNGEAWVFPVGIPDVLWFQFRNPHMNVFIDKSLDEALRAVTYGSQTERVFVFDENGWVREVKKPRSMQ